MRSSGKQLIYVLLINIFGSFGLIAPLVGAVLSIKNRRWDLFILSVVLFFSIKKVIYVIENRLKIRSPSNPEARKLGSGITIVAPWLKSKKKNRVNNK